MNRHLVKFSVNGKRTEQIVTSFNIAQAKEIIMAQYSGQNVVFYSVTKI